jgi:Pyruvate/2-oxoacid:ferredoxin oxidoreductase delta subunit
VDYWEWVLCESFFTSAKMKSTTLINISMKKEYDISKIVIDLIKIIKTELCGSFKLSQSMAYHQSKNPRIQYCKGCNVIR